MIRQLVALMATIILILKLGYVVIRNIPVEIEQVEHCLIGTGVLRHFLATVDYPNGKLVLRPKNRSNSIHAGMQPANLTNPIPFVLMVPI